MLRYNALPTAGKLFNWASSPSIVFSGCQMTLGYGFVHDVAWFPHTEECWFGMFWCFGHFRGTAMAVDKPMHKQILVQRPSPHSLPWFPGISSQRWRWTLRECLRLVQGHELKAGTHLGENHKSSYESSYPHQAVYLIRFKKSASKWFKPCRIAVFVPSDFLQPDRPNVRNAMSLPAVAFSNLSLLLVPLTQSQATSEWKPAGLETRQTISQPTIRYSLIRK